MFGFFKKKKSDSDFEPEPAAPAPKNSPRRAIPANMVAGYAIWNQGLEEAMVERLEAMGVPLNYQPDTQKTPDEAESNRYGHQSLLPGKNPLDEGILLRKMGCKQLYPRFLAILAKSTVCVLSKSPSREIHTSKRPDDNSPYLAVFSNVDRARDGIKAEGLQNLDIEEKSCDALLKRYPNHGIILNPGCPGITFAIPVEIIEELRSLMGL